MKRYLMLTMSMTFFISSLLLFERNIAIIVAIALILYLELEDIRFSFLPLVLSLIWKDGYSAILLISYILLFISYFKLKQKKLLLLTRCIVIFCIANIAIYSLGLYSLNTLYISLIVFIIYAIITLFYIIENNSIIPIYDKLAQMSLYLLYLILLVFINKNDIALLFLFMQLYMYNDNKFKACFIILYVGLDLIFTKSIDFYYFSIIATSYFPPCSLLYFDYSSYITIFYIIYTILILLARDNKKRVIIDEKYINHLFKDFKEYIDMLGIEKNKSEKSLELKGNHIKQCIEKYCLKCNRITECAKKPDIRYFFILEGLRGGINKYNCPNFASFYLDIDSTKQIKSIEHNSLYDLIDELEFVYSQSLREEGSYNKFLNEISFYGYKPLDIDIYLNDGAPFYKIKLSKRKNIAKALLKNIALKSFKEAMTLKVIENDNDYDIYFYKEPKCHIDYAHIVLAKDNNIVSGDNYYIKKNYNDSYIFALSDGMGSGHDAYLESSRTLLLLSKLINSSFSIKTSLRLLEDILSVRENYDSYATLDMLYLNTSLLKANLFKLGSSVSYLYHNNELIEFQNRALPLRLDDINSAYEIELVSNDLILLLSDGVSDFITKDEIEALIDLSLSPNIILDRIVNKIKEKYSSYLRDDLSLIIIKIVS